jgi:hypothetical protein
MNSHHFLDLESREVGDFTQSRVDVQGTPSDNSLVALSMFCSPLCTFQILHIKF